MVERLVIFSSGSSLDNNIFQQYLEEVGQSQNFSNYNFPPNDLELKDYVDQIEAEYIRQVIESNDNNIEKSSQILGISRPTLYAKIKKFNL